MADKKLTVGEVYGTFNPLQKEALHLIVGQIIGTREVSSSQILHLENTLNEDQRIVARFLIQKALDEIMNNSQK